MPIFVVAELTSPYKSCTDVPLVSLDGSADHNCHRLVASAVPITHSTMDTTVRGKLELPKGPQTAHVIAHLLMSAHERNEELLSQTPPGRASANVRQDVSLAYQHIVAAIGEHVGARQERKLSDMARNLAGAPWVMVQDQKFVAPEELYFAIDEDTEHGTAMHSKLLKLHSCSYTVYIYIHHTIYYIKYIHT